MDVLLPTHLFLLAIPSREKREGIVGSRCIFIPNPKLFIYGPYNTTVAISTVVGYLAKKLKDNKSVQSFFDDFTEATINWIKPVFLREDGTLEKALKEL